MNSLLALVFVVGAALAMDSDPQCCGWAIMDECESNSFWMKTNCQASCGTMGCTVAGAKADKDGAMGPCKSNLDMAALSSCKWNKEFLTANWDKSAHAGTHGHSEGPAESQFIVPDTIEASEAAPAPAAASSGYGGEDSAPAPASDPIPMDIAPEVPEEVVEVVEEVPEIVEVIPEVVEEIPEYVEEIPEPVVVEEAPAPAPVVEEVPEEPEMPEVVEELVEELVDPMPEVPEEVEIIEEAPVAMDAPVEVMGEDKSESCCGWAAFEECEKNPAYMNTMCAASCFVKDGKADIAASITNAEEKCGEYRELFLNGVELGSAKAASEEKPETPEAPVSEESAESVSEEVVEEEAPVSEEVIPEDVSEEEPEEPVVEQGSNEIEEPEVEEPIEEPAMDAGSHGGYRHKFRRGRN